MWHRWNLPNLHHWEMSAVLLATTLFCCSVTLSLIGFLFFTRSFSRGQSACFGWWVILLYICMHTWLCFFTGWVSHLLVSPLQLWLGGFSPQFDQLQRCCLCWEWDQSRVHLNVLGSFWALFTSCVYQLPSLLIHSLVISHVLSQSGGQQFYLSIPSTIKTDEYLTTVSISSFLLPACVPWTGKNHDTDVWLRQQWKYCMITGLSVKQEGYSSVHPL